MASPLDDVRRSLPGPLRAAADLAGLPLGLALAAVAAARRGKAVHPAGVVHAARLEVPGGAPAPPAAELLHRSGELAAVVRFSRSLGTPRPLPDLLGMSLRVVDAYGPGRHQDVMMVSSVDAAVANHVFLPATDVQQRPYSSALPYRAGDRRFLIGALPDPASPRPAGEDEFDRLARAAATGRLRFRLAVAAPWQRFRPVATVHVGERLPAEADALRFNPWNTGGGLRPAGALNALRAYAYPLSQAAWGRARRDGAARQRAARELVSRRAARGGTRSA